MLLRGPAEVRVDQHREHAERAVVLDEPHAAHVRGQVVNRVRAGQRFLARLEPLQIELHVFHLRKALVPFAGRLEVHCANVLMTLPQQVRHEVAADESAAAANDNFSRAHVQRGFNTERRP